MIFSKILLKVSLIQNLEIIFKGVLTRKLVDAFLKKISNLFGNPFENYCGNAPSLIISEILRNFVWTFFQQFVL